MMKSNHTFLFAAMFATALVAGCGDSVTEAVDEVVRCRCLTGDRTAREVDEWKYEAIREATLQIHTGKNGLTLPQLTTRVQQIPGANLRAEIANFEQVVEYVILEMEVRGEFERAASATDESETVYFTRPVTSDPTIES